MSLFDPTQGPVTIRSTEKGTTFEVFQAMQAEKPVGALRFDWSRQGVMMQTIVGHGHGVYVAPFVKYSETVLGYTGRITYFSDFWDMVAYDSALRIAQSDWTTKNRAKFESSHLLVQSKIVAMGVSVVNLATGGILKSYTKRAEFESVVAKQGLPTPAKRPLPR